MCVCASEFVLTYTRPLMKWSFLKGTINSLPCIHVHTDAHLETSTRQQQVRVIPLRAVGTETPTSTVSDIILVYIKAKVKLLKVRKYLSFHPHSVKSKPSLVSEAILKVPSCLFAFIGAKSSCLHISEDRPRICRVKDGHSVCTVAVQPKVRDRVTAPYLTSHGKEIPSGRY